jgi:transitional endoplasmic reticulum ATPase
MTEEATLKVVEAYKKDTGRSIARTDKDTMRQLGLVSGDIIEITAGHDPAAAIVLPAYAEDHGRGIIGIDAIIRSHAEVDIGDNVVIRKAKSNPAVSITLAPTERVRIVGGEDYLKRTLSGLPVQEGEKFALDLLGKIITFTVIDTEPEGIVIPEQSTQITLKERLAEESQPQPTSKEDPAELLTKLKKMVEAGLITEEDYNTKKAEILAKM